MKNAIILHGMSADLDACFGVKLKEDLRALGFNIYEPKFVLHPNITLSKWEEEMDKFRDVIDEDALLVCHSLGTLFILKYLNKRKLSPKMLVTVAGGTVLKKEDCQIPYLTPFLPSENEFKWVRENCEIKYSIFNRNDDIWRMQDVEAYNSRLGSTPVELPYGEHFGRKSGVKEIPELIEIVKKEMKGENMKNIFKDKYVFVDFDGGY